MLPSPMDPHWKALVDHPEKYSYQFLALRILMQRISSKHRAGMSPSDRDSFVKEVHAFFVKNERLLTADISALLR